MNPESFSKEQLGSFETLLRIVEHLRSPQGCPWDRELTHESLKRHLLEECYELLEAIDAGEPQGLAEELGDVLVQVAFHIQIARERGAFGAADVLSHINRKLIDRHPHVFGGERVSDAREVERRWEQSKKRDRGESSTMESIPQPLPALAYSQLMQDRAARAGFDWERIEGVLEKVCEEVLELRQVSGEEARVREMGDLLFSIVNVARWLNLHAEEALRQANRRFLKRFATMERLCRERGLDFPALSLEEKEGLWQEAKALER